MNTHFRLIERVEHQRSGPLQVFNSAREVSRPYRIVAEYHVDGSGGASRYDVQRQVVDLANYAAADAIIVLSAETLTGFESVPGVTFVTPIYGGGAIATSYGGGTRQVSYPSIDAQAIIFTGPPPGHASRPLSDEERCKQEDGQACTRCGIAIAEDQGRNVRGHEALNLFERACRFRDAMGCTRAGLLLEQGSDTVSANPTLAAAMYEKGCDGSDMTACRHLGLLHTSKKITGFDLTRGRALLQRACDGRDSWSCRELGHLYDADGNRAQAAIFFRQGCKLGYQAACDELR